MGQFKFHTERLRASGLRPTKQRLAICKILFDRKETFHFTIEKLKKIAEKDGRKKINSTLPSSLPGKDKEVNEMTKTELKEK